MGNMEIKKIMKINEKKYLGDGVYIEHNGYHWVLTTENGIEVTNTIYLDSYVAQALLDVLNPRK